MGGLFSKIAPNRADFTFRMDEVVEGSFTYRNRDQKIDFLIGKYGRPGFWNHNVLLVSYILHDLTVSRPIASLLPQSPAVPSSSSYPSSPSPSSPSGPALPNGPPPLSSPSSSSTPPAPDPIPQRDSRPMHVYGLPIDIDPHTIQMRTVLIELLYNSTKNHKFFDVKRLNSRREGYHCSDFAVIRASLQDIVDAAITVNTTSGGYSFISSNCRDFTNELYSILIQRFGGSKITYRTGTFLEQLFGVESFFKYWQKFPPNYTLRTDAIPHEYLTLNELVRVVPFDSSYIQTWLDPRAAFGKWFSAVECNMTHFSNLLPGTLVSIEMKDQKPFHHFAIYLGRKADVLTMLTAYRDHYLEDAELDPNQYSKMLHVLSESNAETIQVDHNGRVVALRDFQKEFIEKYAPAELYKVTKLPTETGNVKIISQPLPLLLQRVLPFLGRTVYDASNTCTCVAGAVLGLELTQDPQIPLGSIGARTFDKFLIDPVDLGAIPTNMIFGESLLFPLDPEQDSNFEV